MTIFKFPKSILISLLLLMFICLLGATNLTFRGDYKVFFSQDNQQKIDFEISQDTFSKNESISIIITTKSKDIFNEKDLKTIKDITEESYTIPFVTKVDSITNFQNLISSEDEMEIKDLVPNEFKYSPNELINVKETALKEQELLNSLISKDGKVTVVNATINLPIKNQTELNNDVVVYTKNMLSKYENDNISIELSGIIKLNDTFFTSSVNDSQTLFPIMFFVIGLVLVLLLKSFKAMFFTFFIIFASIASTMGISGYLGFFISVATVNVPIIIMTLAVADSIHILSSYKDYRKENSNLDSVIKSLKLNLKPIFITSFTTTIGFLTLNFSKVPILNDLGNMVSIGVIFACIYSLLLLPALLILFPIDFKESKNKSNLLWSNLNIFINKNYKLISILFLFIMPISLHFSMQNNLNDVVIEYFDKKNEFRKTADYQEKNLSGFSNIDFTLKSNEEYGINNPIFLNAVDEFSEWLSSQKEVGHVLTYSNTIKRINKNINNNNDYFRIPENKEIASQYLLLYEMSLPYGFDLYSQISIDKSKLRISASLDNMGSKEFIEFEKRALSWWESKGYEYELSAASLPLIFAYISEINMESMFTGTVTALLIISLLIAIVLKSIKLGLISLVSNLLPIMIGFSIWYIISGNINMGLSVVIALTMGIVVDDTVHFLSKYQHYNKYNKSSILGAYQSTGNALIITTLILFFGFLTLSFSNFTLNSEMGLLTSIVVLFALIVDLIILPSLLKVIDRKNC